MVQIAIKSVKRTLTQLPSLIHKFTACVAVLQINIITMVSLVIQSGGLVFQSIRPYFSVPKGTGFALARFVQNNARRVSTFRRFFVSTSKLLFLGVGRFLRLVHGENILVLPLIVAAGIYFGLATQAKLTRLSASSVFNSVLDVAGGQSTRFKEPTSNNVFGIRTEVEGMAMQLPHMLTESESLGNECLLVRYWVYKLPEQESKDDKAKKYRAQDLLAICEVLRTGNASSFDVRVRLAIEKRKKDWRWIDLGAGDVDSRLLKVGGDSYSPLRFLNQHFGYLESWYPTDYVSKSQPTNSAAIEVSFDRLAEGLSLNNKLFKENISGSEDEFKRTMNTVANRIIDLDTFLQSKPSLFVVSALGGACQSVAFSATAVILLFLVLQSGCVLMVGDAKEVGGAFADECQSTIRLSGLVGTLIFLGAALSCVSVSPDPVKSAVSTARMSSLAGQAFMTTLVSSICVRMVEAVHYLLSRLVRLKPGDMRIRGRKYLSFILRPFRFCTDPK